MATLALYDFTGQAATTTAPVPATSAATDTTASALGKGAGLSALEIYTAGGYTTAPTLRVSSNTSTSSATAVSLNSYWEFTVTPASGKSLTLAGLAFKVARGGSSTIRGFIVRTSLDGYASNVVSATDITTVRPTLTSYSYDWSALTVPAITPITVRVYVYNGAAGSTVEFDDIALTGDVVSAAVTVPATVTMTGSSSMTGTGTAQARAAATLAGSSAVTVTPRVDHPVGVAIAGSSTLGVVGTGQTTAAATVVGSSTVTVTPRVEHPAAVTITGSNQLAVTPPAGQQTAAATMTGAGQLTIGSVIITRTVIITMAGQSTMSAVGAKTAPASLAITGTSSMTAGGSQTTAVALQIIGANELTATAQREALAQLLMIGVSTVDVAVVTGPAAAGRNLILAATVLDDRWSATLTTSRHAARVIPGRYAATLEEQ